jgi:DNA-binding HxlR family transcriptional regulator
MEMASPFSLVRFSNLRTIEGMKGYSQFCPVAQALEVLGERWTLLVVRELLMGSTRFSDLQKGVPTMSRSVLTQRLKALCDAGVVERVRGEYHLTKAGQELRPIVLECGNWGARWVRRKLKDADVDVGLLMWDMRRGIDIASIPREAVLVEMRFNNASLGKGRYFLHFKVDEVDLCLTNPGHEIDLKIETTPRALAEVWLGMVSFASAVRSGAIKIEGPKLMVRDFPEWLQLSPFAPVYAQARG